MRNILSSERHIDTLSVPFFLDVISLFLVSHPLSVSIPIVGYVAVILIVPGLFRYTASSLDALLLECFYHLRICGCNGSWFRS